MKESGHNKILIIDDSIEHIKILISLLEDLYDVHFAKNGEQGLALLNTNPDLILLDILMPEMDGFEVCQRIKRTDKWKETPLIFISGQGEDEDESKGLELGAIDFITKPFNPSIVRARIRNHLKLRAAMEELKHLYSLALDANPITGLPGNNSIIKQIEKKILSGEEACVIYSDIDNFKAYNDSYGFARGDEVINFTAKALKDSVEKSDCLDSFVGHIGGDDFIMIVPSEHCALITDEVVRTFDREITQFYNRHDIDLQQIESTNRQGEPETYPIMTISIAGIDLTYRKYTTYLEVTDACVEIKKKAKAIPGSIVCFDQRKTLE